MIRFVHPKRLPVILGCLVVAAPVLRILCTLGGYDFAGRVLTACRADSLLLGVLAAMGVRNAAIARFFQRFWPWILGIAISSAAMAVRSHAFAFWNPREYTWLSVSYTSLLVVVVSAPGSWIGNILRMKWLRNTGMLAYCLYLFHQAISGLCFAILRHKPPTWSSPMDVGVTLLAALLTFGFAKISWKYLERPLISRSHSYVY